MFREIIQCVSLGSLAALAYSHDAAVAGSASGGFELRVVSSRAEAVSGGDVLVQLDAPNCCNWVAQLDGRDVTTSFRPAGDTGKVLALLSGLNIGSNSLEIRVRGEIEARLDIVNYPMAGPIFSGAHQTPFLCQTVFNGMGRALDADCNAKTVVQYYYKSTKPVHDDPINRQVNLLRAEFGKIPFGLPAGFKVYKPGRGLPSDVAQTTMSDGRVVPFIVRRELGVINRAVYEIRFLHQPGEPLPTPWHRLQGGWNGQLMYIFGGGLRAAYHQGNLYDWASDHALIAQGYATATSTFNTFFNNSNDVVSAETVSMVKEHFIKRYGVPTHTIGWGGSGGAMQLYLIAQNYPGLLDGIIPYISYPDALTFAQSIVGDCSLLSRAFDHSQQAFTEEQKSAISGFATWRSCGSVARQPEIGISPHNCAPDIPEGMIYDRLHRPHGVRCDMFDNEINVYGHDPKTGFARRPLDNVGVQYGLTAFKEGKIGAEQFVSLNEQMGGYDADGNWVSGRMDGDPDAIRRAYLQGQILTGGGGLGAIPIIDWRSYSDDAAGGHDSFESFATRARLTAANGTSANQVIQILPRGATYDQEIYLDPDPATSFSARRELDLVRQMRQWLDNMATDTRPGSLSEKVARDRPSEVSDACWATSGERIAGDGVFDHLGRCSQLYPHYGSPRTAAGGAFTDDVLKCTLRPIKEGDYSPSMTAEQLQRLRTAFPAGVCDSTRPGIGQEVTRATWQRF